MTCERITGHGFTAIVCSRGRRAGAKKCSNCQRRNALLICDGCDRPVCQDCSVSPFDDTRESVDLCPACAKPAFVNWRDNHGGASAYAVLGREKARDQFRVFVRADPNHFVELLALPVRVALDRELGRRSA
jgi:hypothetical protein